MPHSQVSEEAAQCVRSRGEDSRHRGLDSEKLVSWSRDLYESRKT